MTSTRSVAQPAADARRARDRDDRGPAASTTAGSHGVSVRSARDALRTRLTSTRRSARSCATSPRPRSRRTPRPGTASTCSRPTWCWRMGELGLFGIPFPEEYGGGGADLTTLCVAIEELGRVDQSMAITLEAGVGLGANPIHQLRHRGAAAAVAARPVRRPRPRRLRPHRARRRERRRRHPHQGGARRGDGRVGDQRREGVHHQLGHADHVARHGHRGHRTGAGAEISTIVVPAGTPGFDGAAAVPEDGLARVRHARPDASPTAGCRPANLLGERGRGFAKFLAILDDGRIAIAALAVGVIEALPRACRRVRQGAQRVRPAHRRQPGASRSSAPTWP